MGFSYSPRGVSYSPCKCRGVSLIEVLVTVVILSVGLLGVAAMQASSLQSGQAAYQRSQANTIAAELADQLRSNRSTVLSGNDLPNLGHWEDLAEELLPQGTINVTVDGDGAATVTVSWVDQRGRDAPDEAEAVVLTTRI